MRMCKAISKVVMSIILAKCKDTQTEDQTVSACLSVTLAHQLTLIFFPETALKRLLIAVTDSCLPSHQTYDQTVSACLSVTP